MIGVFELLFLHFEDEAAIVEQPISRLGQVGFRGEVKIHFGENRPYLGNFGSIMSVTITQEVALNFQLFSALKTLGLYLHRCTSVLRNFVFVPLRVLDFVLAVFESINYYSMPANIFQAIRDISQHSFKRLLN